MVHFEPGLVVHFRPVLMAHIGPEILVHFYRIFQYMIDFNLGATTSTIFEIKKIYSDYFEEED